MLSARKGPAFDTPGAEGDTIAKINSNAGSCTRCDLYRHATHLVFGEGPTKARIVLVGEQPGDKEDAAARPFVGPAGKLLDHSLQEAGVDRDLCYVTNAVKHFKFTTRGKLRIHAKPTGGEIQACAWWLAAEFRLLKPALAVALGATALYTLLGRGAKVTRDRGQILTAADGTPVLVTVHPSALLRSWDQPDAQVNRTQFIDDLRKIADFLE